MSNTEDYQKYLPENYINRERFVDIILNSNIKVFYQSSSHFKDLLKIEILSSDDFINGKNQFIKAKIYYHYPENDDNYIDSNSLLDMNVIYLNFYNDWFLFIDYDSAHKHLVSAPLYYDFIEHNDMKEYRKLEIAKDKSFYGQRFIDI